MPEQAKPIARLREPESPHHHVWLEQNTTAGDLDLKLESPPYMPIVKDVSDIISARLGRVFGMPPDTEVWAAEAYLAYPPELGIEPGEMFREARNTLADLERHCDGSKDVIDVLAEYRKRLSNEEAAGDSVTPIEILKLKPVLFRDEVQHIVTEVLRPFTALSDSQKRHIVSTLTAHLGDYPRPDVVGSTNTEKEKDMGTPNDILYLGIQQEVGAQVPDTANQMMRDYLITELYKGLQNAYADRTRDMQR